MGHATSLEWLQLLVEERLSPEVSVAFVDGDEPVFRLSASGKSIEMPSWTWEAGTAVSAHAWLDVEADGWVSVLGGPLPAPNVSRVPQPIIEAMPDGYRISYDVLGFAAWMLGRFEEIGRADLDEHGRFPARASHASRHGYLERPAVDEWFAVLRQIAERLWPGMRLAGTGFRVNLTHDVDAPSEYVFCRPLRFARNVAGDLLKRASPQTALRRLKIRWTSGRALHSDDPYNTFEWLMDNAERRSLRSAFYFVCGRTTPAYDPEYDPGHPAIRRLMRVIHQRGHEIGLHGSYGAYRRAEVIKHEADTLIRLCDKEGIAPAPWGGRMHYLRWETPTTARALDEAGAIYDSTLGYADSPGFRCGTCFEYRALDTASGQPLKLVIRPLIAMDCTLITRYYMGLEPDVAAGILSSLKSRCRSVGGAFTLLWHNSQLTTAQERELYESVLDA